MAQESFTQRVWFLVGPTASGKTSLGIEVAERVGAEILSLDSMALYCRMDIGTAKPSADERQRIPHHLVDLAEPHEAFSTGRYLAAADAAIADVVARGRLPLFVGGTLLYLKALTEGFFEGPAADWNLRNRLVAQAEADGTEALHRQLAEADPEAAGRIHPNDLRRIVRALEVFEVTGVPISAQQTQFGQPSSRYDCVLAGIRRDRQELYSRINRRVDAMFEAGMVGEVRGLLADPRGISHAAAQFVGYKEIIAYLHGDTSLDDARELVQTHTRQFAKRQFTWFRRFPQIRWVDASPQSTVEELADAVIEALELDGPRDGVD
ncbi:MAG: tRNA (adenosine(37)-N6)-dimethylallyltransferase MiaA [Candidatus Brocadiae bacterium]|nr:tRNA (adenosine(37)-N6)-dimethylallyltransferase MiaA [Candidatus Brocadiia bacterium]